MKMHSICVEGSWIRMNTVIYLCFVLLSQCTSVTLFCLFYFLQRVLFSFLYASLNFLSCLGGRDTQFSRYLTFAYYGNTDLSGYSYGHEFPTNKGNSRNDNCVDLAYVIFMCGSLPFQLYQGSDMGIVL